MPCWFCVLGKTLNQKEGRHFAVHLCTAKCTAWPPSFFVNKETRSTRRDSITTGPRVMTGVKRHSYCSTSSILLGLEEPNLFVVLVSFPEHIPLFSLITQSNENIVDLNMPWLCSDGNGGPGLAWLLIIKILWLSDWPVYRVTQSCPFLSVFPLKE